MRGAAPALEPLGERKARLLRAGIAEPAISLLLDAEFDSVTIEQLAKAAGISRRTFFRYFATKEEVVLTSFDVAGEELLEALRRQPAHLPPLLAVRQAMRPLVARFARDAERTRALLSLIQRTPALRAGFLDRQDRWRELLSLEIERRLPRTSRRPLIARLTAAVSMGAADAAMAAWAHDDVHGLGALTEQAFVALEAVVGGTSGRAPKAAEGVRPRD